MIIAFRQRFSHREIFFAAQGIVLGMILLCFIRFFVGVMGVERVVLEGEVMRQRSSRIEGFLTGPLALRENRKSPTQLALEQKLVFLAQSVRPDFAQEEKVLRIGIRGTDVERVIREGEPVSCRLVEHVSGGIEQIEFVDDGSVSMIPHMLDGRSLLLKVVQATGESMEVVLKTSSNGGVESGDALAQARWLGKDVFFQQYGGGQYQPLGQKEQIEVGSGKRSYVLYVGKGDYLSLKDQRWVVVGALDLADRTNPLAHVREVDEEGVQIEAWDEKGFPLFFSSLKREEGKAIRFDATKVFLEAKQRTTRQVSCKVGKKRFVLQPGDWILQSTSGWHKLVGMDEIDAFLLHDIKGSLCVIDSIDGKGLIKGKCIDETRTCVESFQFKAVSSKGNKKEKIKW